MLSLAHQQILPPKHWQDFESLCNDLFGVKWRDFHAQKHGRSGQRQQGVDVFGQPANVDGFAGVQCRLKELFLRKRLTRRELLKAVREAKSFRPPLREFILAAPVPRDANIQRVARELTQRHLHAGLFSVHVYSWDDLQEMLANYPEIYWRHYGPPPSAGHTASALGEDASMATSLTEKRRRVHKSVPSANGSPRNSLRHPGRIVLPPHSIQPLGIIATAPLPTSAAMLALVFPSISWATEVPLLTKTGVVEEVNGALQVPKTITAAFLADKADRERFIREWIAVLEPLRSHVDTALYLGLSYMKLRSFAPAVMALVDIADGLEPGSWNGLYAQCLVASEIPKIVRQLTPEQRIRFYNALGLCLARGASPLDALPVFEKLRRYCASRRTRFGIWGVGQSFINGAVALANARDTEGACVLLEKAIAHGRHHRDFQLVGRALNNLAVFAAAQSPQEASRLLEESIAAKTKAQDAEGEFASIFTRGLIAAYDGDHAASVRIFTVAERLSRRIDDRHGRSLTLCNLGTAYLDLDHPRRGLPFFLKARRIAEEERFTDALVFALRGEARASERLDRYADAERLHRRLYDIHLEQDQLQDAVIALHDAGVALVRQRRWAQGREAFRESERMARAHSIDWWTYQCRKDYAISYRDQGRSTVAVRILRNAASTFARQKKWYGAARLLSDIVNLQIQDQYPPSHVEPVFVACLDAWDKVETGAAEKCQVFEKLATWRWSHADYQGALDALRDMAKHARTQGLRAEQSAALEQRGAFLQELGQYEEAESAHREALAVARSIGDEERTEVSLNNLAELLRKTDRARDALPLYREAEASAQNNGNAEGAIRTAHNRALALLACNRKSQGLALLRQCRDRAYRLGLKSEHIRALHSLANASWELDRPASAERFLQVALVRARKWRLAEQVSELSFALGATRRYQGRAKEALPLLRTAEAWFRNDPDCHHRYAELAACYDDIGRPRDAHKCWLQALRHAATIGDREIITDATVAIASLLANRRQYQAAEKMLRDALRTETTPELRASLLQERLRQSLDRDRERRAATVYAELEQLGTKHDEVRHALINARMWIGDFNWKQRSSRLEAMKFYIAAMSDAAFLDPEVLFQIGGHAVQKLVALDPRSQLEDINRLEHDVLAWLTVGCGLRRGGSAIRLVTWPLGVARGVATFPGGVQAMSERRYAQLVLRSAGLAPYRRKRKKVKSPRSSR